MNKEEQKEDELQDQNLEIPSEANQEETPAVSPEELEQLQKDSAELRDVKDRLLRTVAEYENTKKRLEKQKEEFVQYANRNLLSEFLPIVDNLSRAIQSAEQNHSVESLLEGVNMIQKLLLETLKNHGLERIESVGQAFDPNLHEAVGTVESNEYAEDVVAEEISAGYKYKEILLKPAMVRVSSGPSADSKEGD